jgi:hypothetical protein
MWNDVNQISRSREWDAKHGGKGIVINGWVLHEDGAEREVNPMGVFCEPSPDPVKRAKAIVLYREVLLRRVTQEFVDAKHMLEAPAQRNLKEHIRTPEPPNLEQAVAELKQLRARGAEAQASLDEARDAVIAAKPQHVVEQEQRAAENRVKNEAYLAELAKIKV